MSIFEIDFEPLGKRASCEPGWSLLDCARRHGIGIASVCGGLGTCHSCKIQVLSGAVSPLSSSEKETFTPDQLKAGWRLACQTYPRSDCKLYLPPESMTASQRTQVEGLEVAIPPEPAVTGYYVKVPCPSMDDSRADAERLLDALNSAHRLNCQTIDIDVLRSLSDNLRLRDWKARAFIRDSEVLGLTSEAGPLLGLAVDLGTTKIAGYLVDLSNGRTLSAKGVTNPQVSYGEDIISRVTHSLKAPSEARRLQELVMEAINQLASDLCRKTGASTDEIADAVIVGNTAMHHLALRLPVRQLTLAPFPPAVTSALDVKARDTGLRIAAGAYVHFLPNMAGFVGADHVAMLLATEAEWDRGTVLTLDIGTNTEVSLIHDRQITTASCASGPAFEGGHIKDGMRAAAGAIERVRLENGVVQYQTIEAAPPVGICGSGILDAMAQLYLAGILDSSGRMLNNHPRVRTTQEQREFVLVTETERKGTAAIVLTQRDVRQLQLAKAAIRTGIQMLLEGNNLAEDRLDRTIIAGAFGSYIDVASAVAIGMLPALPLERFKQVGNAAGTGARMALVSRSQRRKAIAIASRVQYLELASAADFNRTFTAAGYLGRYRLARGRRETIR